MHGLFCPVQLPEGDHRSAAASSMALAVRFLGKGKTMAMSLGTKAERMLKLLIGVRNPRVASALASYGFTEQTIQEGWELLQAVGKTRYDVSAPPGDVQVISQLDAWENQWFPIAYATLQRHFPASHGRLFLNLSQTEGPEVAISVRTFLDRFDLMSKGADPYGAEGPKAAAILAQRGLNADAVRQARVLLEQLGKVAPAATPLSLEDEKAALQRTEDALWAYYLEWSQVARIAVKQRPLLRQLGFLVPRSSGDTGSEDPEPPEGPTPAPVASPTGGAPVPAGA